MKLRVLGSSSKGNCYLLESDTEVLIVECGIHQKSIITALNYHLEKVVGVLVTHEHNDHAKSVKALMQKGINIYASGGTLEKVGAEGHRAIKIESERPFNVGEFLVMPFETEHDAVEPLGFLIQHKDIGRLLFITDTCYCKYKFKHVDYLLIEANYQMEILEEKEVPISLKTRIMKSHFEINNAIDYIKELEQDSIKNIVLLHLSDSNSNENEFKKMAEKATGKTVYIADTGLEIELSR